MPQQDFDALVPPRDFNRRDFVRTAVGGGFAAAVLPISAQTVVKTDSHGLLVGEVTIPVGDFKMPAYRAAPLGKANAPVVLVISEIFGVHEHIADIARRLAKAGCFAVAPELFVRQGDAGSYGEVSKLVAEVINKVPDTQVLGDLDATLAWAAAEGANTAAAGITGFCWGGRIVWLAMAHNRSLKAGVAWYGRLVGTPAPLFPKQPIDVVGELGGPVLGLYGGQDPSIPLASVDRMRAALADAGAQGNTAAKKSEIVVYPDAPHAFNADYRPSYRADAAEDGWQRTLAWFKANGVA